MLKRRKRDVKLRSWISFGVVSIIFIQAVISISTIMLTGTPKHLDMSAVNSFDNMVMTRGKLFESQMTSLKEIDDFESRVQIVMRSNARNERVQVSDYIKDEKYRRDFLERMSSLVLDRLRNSGATSCYIILDRQDSDSIKDAVILRDLNPNDNPRGNSDILVEAGSSRLMFEKGFTLDSYWSEHFTVTPDMDFFYKPYEAGNNYPGISAVNLGYFSETTSFFENDIKQICYSVPILDENHRSIGVIGYGVSLDYLEKSIPSSELGEDSSYTYCIGILNEESNDIRIMLTENAAFQAMLSIKESIPIKKDEAYPLYHFDKSWKEGDLYANFAYMDLYKTNTPFEQNRWVLVGVAKGSALFEASKRLQIWIGISVFVSLIISLIIAMSSLYPLIFPIKALMDGIENSDNNRIETLPKTYIKEFDELADRIILNNQMVYKMGGKVADIIELAGIPLGVVEYEKNSDLAFCNKQLLEMLELSVLSWKNNYAEKEELKNVFQATSEQYTKVEPYIFKRTCKNRETQYYRISHAETEDSQRT